MSLKYYGIEEQTRFEYPGNVTREITRWRYFSLYNGARGIWYSEKEKAIKEGEAHKALIIALSSSP